MNTTAITELAKSTRTDRARSGPAGGGDWWKAWVLVTSIAATVLGWLAFTAEKPSTASAVVSPQGLMPIAAAPVLHVKTLDEPTRLPPGVRALPTMPQPPVFQAPVTRTRRS